MLSLVLIITLNEPIPTMKIRQKQYKTVFMNLNLFQISCYLSLKAQVVNKAWQQALSGIFLNLLHRRLWIYLPGLRRSGLILLRLFINSSTWEGFISARVKGTNTDSSKLKFIILSFILLSDLQGSAKKFTVIFC